MIPAIPPSAPFRAAQAAALFHPGYVVGRWYWAQRAPVAGSSAIGTSVAKFQSFMLAYPITISDLAVQIATASAAGNIQLAIYASDPVTHLPSGAPLAATASISTTSVGNVSADITGADVLLPAGLYWSAVQADNATVALMGPSVSFADYLYLLGTTTLANLGGSNSPRGERTVAATFGTWPNVTSTPTTEENLHTHMIAFKVSAIV